MRLLIHSKGLISPDWPFSRIAVALHSRFAHNAALMKKTLLFLLLAAPVLFAQTGDATRISAVDGYAARVNSTIITYGDIRESIGPYIQQLLKTVQGEELARRIQAAYIDGREALIEEALLKAEAESRGLALPENIIEDEVNRLIRERFNNDRALLTRALASRRMTLDEWKKEVADQLTIRVFYSQEVTRRASVSIQAVRDEYERIKKDLLIPFRVKYRLILINKGITEEELRIKRQQAEETLKKLQNGADFDAVAETVSEGDSSLTPWRDPADVREELRPVLRNTPAGQISGLIETDKLYYIVKVEERREEGFIPFEEAREQIEQDLLEQERERLHKELIERLSQTHFIERY